MTRIGVKDREFVRLRSIGHCEYCRKPEGYGLHKHQIDHIRSQKHKGSDAPSNLAWACLECNRNKGADIAGYDPKTNTLSPLFNPRTLRWEDHFRFEDAVIIVGLSLDRKVGAIVER
jgi:5-methylcytosine-specific restriction endonuclease McrA